MPTDVKPARAPDPAALVLGYLNFSSGAFDPAAWRACSDLYAGLEPADADGVVVESPDSAGRLRDEFLATEIFEGVRDARALTASWRHEYNTQRPHSSLGYQTPAGFAAACAACGEAPCS